MMKWSNKDELDSSQKLFNFIKKKYPQLQCLGLKDIFIFTAGYIKFLKQVITKNIPFC